MFNDHLERAELAAQLAEARAVIARTEAMRQDAESRIKTLEASTVMYMDQWLAARDRAANAKRALLALADTLEKEGLMRSAQRARDAALAAGC